MHIKCNVINDLDINEHKLGTINIRQQHNKARIHTISSIKLKKTDETPHNNETNMLLIVQQ